MNVRRDKEKKGNVRMRSDEEKKRTTGNLLYMSKYEKKYYSLTDKMFHVETYLDKELIADKKYRSFKSFAKAINFSFDGVDLYHYKFKRNRIHGYDLSKAILNADNQKEIGVFNEKLYNKLVGQFQFDALENKKCELCLRKPQFEDADDYDNNIIYISDIHLNCKKEFNEIFSKQFNEYDLIYYIKEYADKLIKAYNEHKRPKCFNDFCFILGDLSYNITINYYFLKMIKGKIRNLYYVLGNHELWNYDNVCDNPDEKLSQIRSKYNNMLNELDINFLNNTLIISDGYKQIRKIEESQLEELDIKDIREACIKFPFIVFGGIGYAGYNVEYNAERQIYRETLSREDEIKETLKFERLYNKLVMACSDLKVTIATHMPFEDWCKGSRVSGWTYINGHTHKNGFIYDSENNIKDFHDNQVGYYSQSISFRNVLVKSTYDIFKDYEDGIYDSISREEYIDFYRGRNNPIEFNREFKKIIMLKKSGFYFFMLQDNNGNLYYLEGGKIRKTFNKSMDYFYQNMIYMINIFTNRIAPIQTVLSNISNFVKSFGGSGKIHGTIVDIDFYNHIHMESNGKIHYYYAENNVEHFEYKDLASLLKCHNIKLFKRFENVLANRFNNELVTTGELKGMNISNEFVKHCSKLMYKDSNNIYKLQYIFSSNVLRFWNFEFSNRSFDELYDNNNMSVIDNSLHEFRRIEGNDG